MSRGKYLSLEEARKEGKLKQFAKDHPSKGEQRRFDKLLSAMIDGESKNQEPDEKTSR